MSILSFSYVPSTLQGPSTPQHLSLGGSDSSGSCLQGPIDLPPTALPLLMLSAGLLPCVVPK